MCSSSVGVDKGVDIAMFEVHRNLGVVLIILPLQVGFPHLQVASIVLAIQKWYGKTIEALRTLRSVVALCLFVNIKLRDPMFKAIIHSDYTVLNAPISSADATPKAPNRPD